MPMLLMLLNPELLIYLCPMNDLHFLEEGLEEGSHPKTRQVKTGYLYHKDGLVTVQVLVKLMAYFDK